MSVASPALDFAARAKKQIEVAPLEMRIEIGETEKRAGVGRRDPRFSPASGRHHRASRRFSRAGFRVAFRRRAVTR